MYIYAGFLICLQYFKINILNLLGEYLMIDELMSKNNSYAIS